MKQVGIYTFINTENYGALLQACAISHLCKKNGYAPTFITHGNASGTIKWNIKHDIWQNIRLLLGYKQRLRSTRKFKNTYLPCDINPDNESINIKYDKLITGSDQVWNPDITKNNFNFLLSHITDNTKKIAYAASFGRTNLPTKYIDIYREYISTFTHISVRENSGIRILNDIGIYNAKTCLEPTLLLNSNQWNNVLQIDTTHKSSKYILCYLMPGNRSNKFIKQYAKVLSRKTGYKLRIVGDREYNRVFSNKYITTAGPKEFVELIANASIVLTNSFHGTCFSINYHKNFISFIWQDGSIDNRNSRISCLLNDLNISHCLFKVNNKVLVDNVKLFELDYQTVDDILNHKREDSLHFLATALK